MLHRPIHHLVSRPLCLSAELAAVQNNVTQASKKRWKTEPGSIHNFVKLLSPLKEHASKRKSKPVKRLFSVDLSIFCRTKQLWRSIRSSCILRVRAHLCTGAGINMVDPGNQPKIPRNVNLLYEAYICEKLYNLFVAPFCCWMELSRLCKKNCKNE